MNQMYLEPTIKKQIGKSHVNLNYNLYIYSCMFIHLFVRLFVRLFGFRPKNTNKPHILNVT